LLGFLCLVFVCLRLCAQAGRLRQRGEIRYPSAKEMSFLSFEKYNKNDFVDVAYFEPYYLKDFMMTFSKK
jgi:hypothetical protein